MKCTNAAIMPASSMHTMNPRYDEQQRRLVTKDPLKRKKIVRVVVFQWRKPLYSTVLRAVPTWWWQFCSNKLWVFD
jgi:hypothetical protein